MTAPLPYLPNPIHTALTTANASFALVNGAARRFRPGTIPFAAVPEPSAAALADLLPLLAPGDEVFLVGDLGEPLPLIPELEVVVNLAGVQMRFAGTSPTGDDDPRIVPLTEADTAEMIELNARVMPGFFGPHAPELGAFFGIRDPQTGKLVAMGGERLATFADREASAICTDPQHLGRGHGARIVRAVLRHHARMGTGSVLHVGAGNARAIALYERLGFHVTGPIDFVKVRLK
jgi:RimJ/RimL family protein N-acetyltransferase